MKTKVTIIGKREWEKTNDLTGERIHCFFYQAFDDKSKPLEFQSNNKTYTVNKVLKFDQEKSIEVDLYAKYDSFKSKMKFIEVEPE